MTENKNAKTPTDDGHVAHVCLFEKTGRPMVAWDNAKDIKLGDRLPVAWISEGGDVSRSKRYMDEMGFKCSPLYTAPPKAAEWVGLTDEEIHDLIYLSQKIDASNSEWFDRLEFARAIEEKLKEKNQ